MSANSALLRSARYTPSQYEWTYTYVGEMLGVPPVVIDSRTVLQAITTLDRWQRRVTSIRSIDMVSGTINWAFKTRDCSFSAPLLVDGGTVYAGSDMGAVFALDLATGKELAVYPADGPVFARPAIGAGLLVLSTTSGLFSAWDLRTRQLAWRTKLQPSQDLNTKTSAALFAGESVLVSVSIANTQNPCGGLYALDVGNGDTIWCSDFGAAILTNLIPTPDLDLIFFGCDDTMLRAVHVSDGTPAWQQQTGAWILGDPAYDGEWVYWGSMDGVFYAHPARPETTPDAGWFVPINAQIPTGVVIVDQTALFGATDTAGGSDLYVLDLTAAAAGQPKVIVGSLSGALCLTPYAAAERLALLVESPFESEIISLDLDILAAEPPSSRRAVETGDPSVSLQQQVRFDAQLMVDSYDLSQPTLTPTEPSFQMSIGLVDENGAPRSGCSVVIWATEQTTLTAGGQQYTIGPGTTATISADAAGEIFATLTGGLASPNIWMVPEFFIDGFSMEVFPDTENLNRLSTVTGTDLMAASGYNGQPVLQQAYRSGASAESLALAIQNGVGRQSSVSASSAVRIRKAGDSGGRSLQPGRNWGFDFTNEGARFRYRSELDAGRESRQLAEARDFLGIGDFIANIVEGTADEVASLTWTWDNDLVQIFVTGAQHLYSFTVTTIEDAVKVVTGILKKAAAGIEMVIEWLSFLFEWPAIVHTHRLLHDQVKSGLQSIRQWAHEQVSSQEQQVNQWFQNETSAIVAQLDRLIGQLQGQTIGSVRSGSSPMQPNGHDLKARTNWLISKVNGNVGDASFAALPFAGGESLVNAVQTFITTFVAEVGGQIPEIRTLMETALANLAAFVNDGFTSTGIADLLGIVVSLIELLMTIAGDVVDAFFALLDSIIPLIIGALDATIEIPFVSQFYWLITEGDPLTLLDLFCLIVAVPATLATKILTGSNPSDIALGSTNWLGIAYGCSTYVTTPFWIANDVATTPIPPLAYIALAGTALNEMLSLAVLCGSSPAFDDFLLYAVELVPLVFGIFGLQVSPDQQPGWSETSTFLSGAYGLLMMGLYGLYAAVRPDTYYAPEGKTLFMDLCSALPNLGQWLKYDSDVGSAGVALVDATGYLATAEIAVDLYW